MALTSGGRESKRQEEATMKRRYVMPRTMLAAALLAAMGALPGYASEPIDINTATAEQLATAITGVGLKKAEAIIAYRNQNGPFGSVEELSNVSGIGEATIARSRERLSVR
jgi:competence protein ComEA